MEALTLFFAFIFGLVLGSFANVVILRLNTGKTLGGRSQCFSCAASLRWFELVPVASFLFLKGRCRRCKSLISWQYPLVELSLGFLSLFLFQKFALLGFNLTFTFYFLLSLLIWFSLVVIFAYDFRHKIIPDRFSLLFFTSSLLLVFISNFSLGEFIFFEHVLASLLIGLFFYILWRFSSGRWMGFGDVKLSFGIGMYLGLAQGFSAIAFAFWIGALYALSRLFWQKIMGTNELSSSSRTLTMKSEVPFGPFLVLGVLLALFLNSDVFHLTQLFNV